MLVYESKGGGIITSGNAFKTHPYRISKKQTCRSHRKIESRMSRVHISDANFT